MFPVEKIDLIQKTPEKFKLLEAMPICSSNTEKRILINEIVGDERFFTIIDEETTGFRYSVEKIIELGMVEVSYSPSKKRITAIERIYSGYEDPGKEISELITGITGISDADVKGQRLCGDFVGAS